MQDWSDVRIAAADFTSIAWATDTGPERHLLPTATPERVHHPRMPLVPELSRHSDGIRFAVLVNENTVRMERGTGGGNGSLRNFAVLKSCIGAPIISPDLASYVVREVTSCNDGPASYSDAKRDARASCRVHVPEPSSHRLHVPSFPPPLRGRGRSAFAANHIKDV